MYTPEEAAARDRKSKAESAKRRRQRTNEERRERRWRWKNRGKQKRQRMQLSIEGLYVRAGELLDNPRLTYLDANGRLHREEELSAEELIRRWKKAQAKKRRKKPATPATPTDAQIVRLRTSPPEKELTIEAYRHLDRTLSIMEVQVNMEVKSKETRP